MWDWECKERKMVMQCWSTDFLPFLAMVMVECCEMLMITLGKAAMNDGLNNLVYVVYYNALGTLFLLPCLIFHRHRFVKNHQSYFLRLLKFKKVLLFSFLSEAIWFLLLCLYCGDSSFLACWGILLIFFSVLLLSNLGKI